MWGLVGAARKIILSDHQYLWYIVSVAKRGAVGCRQLWWRGRVPLHAELTLDQNLVLSHVDVVDS